MIEKVFKIQRIVLLTIFVISVALNVYLYELYEATKISLAQSLNVKNKDEITKLEKKLRESAKEILKIQREKEKTEENLDKAVQESNTKEAVKNGVLLEELESNSTKILEKIKETNE
ncbi:hypothetical protein [Helicobacter sp. WB40]|uniref:hypothetical protein n=1 Tax=Helicobacter sp. WB40 TaxID=3004130 RepID=UPI0022EBADE3|nr:hypothetical protein [Helicobacter sp. WB40]MDA3967367.1 hypothetical protein [Helicobacter sp. WB40]